MPLIDLILNLAGLLLWLSWQALGVSAATRPGPLSLVHTLKRAEAKPPRRRTPLLFLLALLAARSLIYWQLGPGARWQPFLDLGAVRLQFQIQSWGSMLLYSLLSFGHILAIYYLALLLVAVANTQSNEADPLQRVVRMQLGPFGHLPLPLGLLTPGLFGALLWLALGWPLAWIGLYRPIPTAEMLWQQALVIGLVTYVAWLYLLIPLLLIHLFNSYVYLGHAPIWHFLALTGRNALRPLRGLPFTLGRVDLTPLLVMAAALFVGVRGIEWSRWLFHRAPW